MILSFIMSTPIKISAQQAKRIALHASLLNGNHKLPKGKKGVQTVIDKLGYIQIDTISVVERAHNHTLWTRCSDYIPKYLHDLQAKDKSIFEYWGHAMSYLPMEDYRFYRPIIKRFLKPESVWVKNRLDKHRSLMAKVLKRIKNDGPLSSKDFESKIKGGGTGWWDWRPSKIALELLYWQGKLMISERKNFHRYYDLTERVLPENINLKVPTKLQLTEFWIRRAIQAYGIATKSDINKYLQYIDKKSVEIQLPKMVKKKEITQITIPGSKDIYFALSDDLDTLVSLKQSEPKVHILSPFDNAIILRDRIKKLFDFDYALECYLPAPKRKFGYFVLPLLWGEDFIGRMDVKAERKKQQLVIRKIFPEDGVTYSDEFIHSFTEKLRSFAEFNDCPKIIFQSKSPKELIQPLLKHL